MPLQNPTSAIISRSYWVRIRSRCASSSLPSSWKYASRCASSASIPTIALRIRSSPAT